MQVKTAQFSFLLNQKHATWILLRVEVLQWYHSQDIPQTHWTKPQDAWTCWVITVDNSGETLCFSSCVFLRYKENFRKTMPSVQINCTGSDATSISAVTTEQDQIKDAFAPCMCNLTANQNSHHLKHKSTANVPRRWTSQPPEGSDAKRKSSVRWPAIRLSLEESKPGSHSTDNKVYLTFTAVSSMSARGLQKECQDLSPW